MSSRLPTCAEKVERLISIDCRSPISASTRSKTGSSARTAGGRRPAWWSSAASPSVLSATVLPPVFGPLMTSARRSPSSRSIGTAAAGSSSGWRAPESRTSFDGSTGAPRQPRDSAAARDGQVDLGHRLDERRSSAARSATSSVSSRRIRSTSARSARTVSASALLISTTSNGSTKSVSPELDVSWTTPRTWPRAVAFTARTGRPPRCGDEVLLEVPGQRAAAREPPQLLGDPVPPVAQLPPQAAERRRRVVAEVGAVLLDGVADRVGDAAERRVDRRGELGEERRQLRLRVERGTCGERAADRPCDLAERGRVEHAAARGARSRRSNVADAAQRRLGRLVEQRDRLGRQRLPARDLARVRRGHERASEIGARRGRRRRGQPLEHGRELQDFQRARVHATSVAESESRPPP